MKITKMALNKLALAAMFLMITFAYSINVQADICDAEFEKYVSARKALGNFDNESDEERLQKHEDFKNGDYSQKDILRNIKYTEEGLEHYKQELNKGDTNAVGAVVKNEYELCMFTALRDGKFKSTKQAKNSKTKNSTAESKQSQSANANSQDATDNDSSNNKPLTKAELKAQKAEQQAQQDEQQAQQATQVAQDHQTKANQKRQGKRRRHEPENEAHNCIKPDFGGLYGGMENTCNFKVWYTYCGYHPTENSWLRGMACEKQSFGSDIVGPGKQSAAHTHGVEKLYWFACKDPAWPVDVEFVDGDIKGRCHTVGGGSD